MKGSKKGSKKGYMNGGAVSAPAQRGGMAARVSPDLTGKARGQAISAMARQGGMGAARAPAPVPTPMPIAAPMGKRGNFKKGGAVSGKKGKTY